MSEEKNDKKINDMKKNLDLDEYDKSVEELKDYIKRIKKINKKKKKLRKLEKEKKYLTKKYSKELK
jgi:hypothetical protein